MMLPELQGMATLDSSMATFALSDSVYGINNDWGAKANFEPYKQTLYLFTLQHPAIPIAAWEWNYEGRVTEQVLGYPELLYGRKPWMPYGTGTKQTLLPTRLDQLEALSVDFSCMIYSTAKMNVAIECWITNERDSDEQGIEAEVMWWTLAKGGATPAGSRLVGPNRTYLTFEDTTGKVWEIWKDAPSHNRPWTIWTFLLLESLSSGSIDLLEGLSFLSTLPRGSVSGYITSVEFGTEIWGGSGRVVVQSFTVSGNKGEKI